MRTIYVGVGEYAASKNSSDVIKTMALGSCVAVVLRDPINASVGLIHVALPDSSINSRRAADKPGMFADTGIPRMLKLMTRFGYNGNGNLKVKLIGGAQIMDPNNLFNIGKRNILAIRKILWKYRLGAIAEDVGNSISRTVSVDVIEGRVIISSPGRGKWEI